MKANKSSKSTQMAETRLLNLKQVNRLIKIETIIKKETTKEET